ncbi:hypothetical protein [Desulfobacter latus]|uniref:Uncharacterized protein n=1 Tax=Desulfobacter latus TaxID=2292 RepID=A0A850T524_9BACT|nr:hypothetical protein [Desulfobacter latus]NWH04392.1 hypothetical protein [Desulfobacter latus]
MTNKKLTAAMAAVHMYVKTEEEAAVVAMQNQAADAAANASVSARMGQMNVWGLSGRQAIMNANAMIRQRMLK